MAGACKIIVFRRRIRYTRVLVYLFKADSDASSEWQTHKNVAAFVRGKVVPAHGFVKAVKVFGRSAAIGDLVCSNSSSREGITHRSWRPYSALVLESPWSRDYRYYSASCPHDSTCVIFP